jgi:phosphate transport system substrate-binding protein
MQPLVEELAADFHRQRPFVTIDVRAGGSALGQELAASGQVDLGLVSWLPDGPPPGLRATAIARDGITLIVHPTNPITGVTMLQAREIFAGRMIDWRQLGGSPGLVQVVSREDGSGTRSAFEAMVMADDRVTLTALVMPNSQAVADYVARDPLAIGYVSMGYVNGDVKTLAVEELLPTPENVSRGAYHLTRELVVLHRPNAPSNVKAFLDFALGPVGQAIVARRYGRVR